MKPSNILLDAQGNARLGDAGLSVEIPEGYSRVTASQSAIGTMAYSDPYHSSESKRIPFNDIFSFGVGRY